MIPIPWFARGPLLHRSRQILSVFTRYRLARLVSDLQLREGGLRGPRLANHAELHEHGEALRLALIELGATFIKLGQALSARNDLLPPEYIEELSKLQDEVPPIPFEPIRALIQQELGESPEKIFKSINPTPIASASIGQVYAARLQNDQEVVIKVIRPGVEASIERDLEIVQDIAAWATQNTDLGKQYDLSAIVDEFAYTLRGELDYLREGQNADTFRQQFFDDPRIYIPRVYWNLTTRQVITIERVKGIKINDLAGLDQAGINRKIVAENLMHFALRQVFEFGFYHADPHPGNFFVQPDGSLAVMDFGMVGRLTPKMVSSLLGIARALENRDSDLLVDEMVRTGMYSRRFSRRDIGRDIDHLLDRFSNLPIEQLSATDVSREIMNVALHHGLQFPGELVAMTRAITISEGTGSLLYPDFQLATFSSPYVRKFWMKQRSPATLLPRISQAAIDGFEFGVELPRRASRVLEQLERGQMEFSLNTDRMQNLLSKMQKMTNRLAMAILLAATIVALGFVLVLYRSERWQVFFDWFFGFAFIGSLLWGAWIMWSIWRSNRD
ncbi:MAG TPA: AarF/ABC1/UbiB kinase family protein [Anaerolineaceae bacterium]